MTSGAQAISPDGQVAALITAAIAAPWLAANDTGDQCCAAALCRRGSAQTQSWLLAISIHGPYSCQVSSGPALAPFSCGDSTRNHARAGAPSQRICTQRSSARSISSQDTPGTTRQAFPVSA
jgi:hypothetical protein